MSELRRPATSYRVGSLGPLRALPPEGLDASSWYELRTLTGVEWYDEDGFITDPPPYRDDEEVER